MITITNLSKNFTERTLFRDVSLSIFPGEKIGLTGPNGSGKTTLFSIILGGMESTDGSVQIQKNINIGYLPQESKFQSDRTVIDEVSSGDERIKQLLAEKHQLEDEHKADSMRYGDIMEELEKSGFYEIEHKAEKILMGLGFKSAYINRPVNHLSGGWQMRTLLAKLLVYPYDILLLDEPTNYLDLEATLWLKDFLAKYQGTFLMISHDKVFLNDVTNYTIVLENGRMTKVKGNYEAYEQQKDLNLRGLEKRQKVVEQKKEQLERFTARFHAQPNRAAAVKNKRKMLERLEEESVDLPRDMKSIKEFEFPPTRESGYMVAAVNRVCKSYGEKKIYENLDFEIIKGQKVCLVGPNGAGKSTLLKMIAGVVEPDSGHVKLGHMVERGYFSQTRLDVLNAQRSVLDELASTLAGTYPATKLRTLLGIFNFHGDDVFKSVRVLSGGEKSRLILAKLLLNPPNFMLLDEPTTHLDIDGVEALTRAFKNYKGTLCFISHDLFFVQAIANVIVEVNQGRIKCYPGGLDYYLDKKQQGETLEAVNTREERAVKEKAKEGRRREQEQDSQKLKQAHAEHQKALKRLKEIREEIKVQEAEFKELETESYVKARFIANAYGKDAQVIREYGQRLKWIPLRLREIEARIKHLNEEKERISK